MKYICLGYIEPGKFAGMTEGEQHGMFDECFEYDDHLRANGHFGRWPTQVRFWLEWAVRRLDTVLPPLVRVSV